MKELQILGLAQIGKTLDSSHENYIELREEFRWVRDERFQKLLEKAYPSLYYKYQQQPPHEEQQRLDE
jgi:hypothetical protein